MNSSKFDGFKLRVFDKLIIAWRHLIDKHMMALSAIYFGIDLMILQSYFLRQVFKVQVNLLSN